MSSPSFEAHSESDKNGASDEVQDHVDHKGTRSVVVEASFDEGDGRGPLVESNPNASESRTSPLSEGKTSRHRGHVRNLSEHFYDATSLTGGGSSDQRELSGSSYSSREVGQKHRRGISGEIAQPAEAHRRINSIGNSASVSRQNYSQDRRHQRVDSGLDILTAVAGASREELEMAAGGRGRSERQPWEAPPPAPASIRRSPVELVSYDHSSNATPSHPGPSAPPPPRGHHAVYPPPTVHHHHGPPPPPPPGHYYGAPYPPPHAYPPHQPPHYYPPPPHHYGRHMPPHPPRSGYPVQYSRSQSPYKSPYGHHPMTQPSFPRGSPPEPIYSARDASEQESMSPPVPVPSSHWEGGTTQGVQTVVTTIGVEDGGRTLQPSPKIRPEKSPRSKHHRKTSSLNSLVFLGETAEQLSKQERGHHRVTSSTVSFLNGLDVGLEGDAAFLHNLHASNGTPTPPAAPYEARKEGKTVEARPSPPPPPPPPEPKQPSPTASSGKSKLAPGGTSKRVRRKCTVDGCPNRVVQGGLCISHGAKRKQCKYPGCTKNVKKAGLCSTHGPARKRCEHEGCSKVAVQGGKCIAHGAKKKLCSIDGCTKQAILGGMCKKHHDHNQAPSEKRIQPPPVDSMARCLPVDSEPVAGDPIKTSNRPKNKSRGHTRGLSIFQEMSADTVGNLLLDGPEDPSNESGTENQRRVYGMY